MFAIDKIRNIAIIAHVDHGKTSLVDQLLRQSGTLEERSGPVDRVMDSNDLEKERGITILAKNTAIHWNDYHINIVDTPGHADFGGEVERILSMVDSVLLLVDAVDGPMPQTRFVTQKAFEQGLHPILVINKIDRPQSRPDWVADQVFDLFDHLGATDQQLDFPIIYTSALQGFATNDWRTPKTDMQDLFELIIQQQPPQVDTKGHLQMQISSLDYSSYVGTIGIGRVTRGQIKKGQTVTIVDREGQTRRGKINQVLTHLGLDRHEVNTAQAGQIIAINGIEPLYISDTLCTQDHPDPLPPLTVDEPTVSMTFQVNDSPFCGQDGKYITSRHLKDRLDQELLHNVALRVEPAQSADQFKVSGRGELHLAILIETMRREGFELAVSRPEVIFKTKDGVTEEPFEQVCLDIETEHQGSVMELMGERQGELKDMAPDGQGRVKLEYLMPSRGLIGISSEFLTLTSGSGILVHVFDHYAPAKKNIANQRHRGALIANGQGPAVAYALFNLQNRGSLMVSPSDLIYEGQVVGLHSRDNDLVVNVQKTKQLTNVRASGSDESIILTPALKMTLEQALEFINDDELVEITPAHIRIRKKYLKEHERKRAKNA